MELPTLLEAILFVADKPVPVGDLLELVRKNGREGEPSPFASAVESDIRSALAVLDSSLAPRAIQLEEVAGGFRLATRPDYGPWLGHLFAHESKPPKLSQPALETLAVIAYRQPISRAEIEAVRGVAVGGVLETLCDREVVRVAGRADVPGRPLLYETTPYFLEHFGLRDINDLPNVEELKRVKLPDPPEPTSEVQQDLIHEPSEIAPADRQD
ncbi:MAG: SMC-Scp complex subunit ScpB [Candidatus Methylacidiphilales bacterium]|nr:SMC-Scp complex subunit ScpB [Candidatus Methylacidiphilales bacterium]